MPPASLPCASTGRLPRQAVVLSALAEAQVTPASHLCSLVSMEGVDLIWVGICMKEICISLNIYIYIPPAKLEVETRDSGHCFYFLVDCGTHKVNLD